MSAFIDTVPLLSAFCRYNYIHTAWYIYSPEGKGRLLPWHCNHTSFCMLQTSDDRKSPPVPGARKNEDPDEVTSEYRGELYFKFV